MSSGNLIEVDFGDRLDNVPTAELVSRIAASSAEVRAGFGEIRKDIEWLQFNLQWERRRRKQLERELAEERRRSFPFGDGAVEAALRRVWRDEPVHAGDVAAALVPNPTQSVRVRCGHALARLAGAGRAEKVQVEEHGRPANLWKPCDA